LRCPSPYRFDSCAARAVGDVLPELATCRRRVFSEWPGPLPAAVASHGRRLNTTISDLAKWEAALYTEKLVKRSTLERMWTRTRLNSGETADYGLGWAVFDLEGHKAVGHGGGRNNWIVHFVDSKLTIIVLSNLFRADALALVKGISALYPPLPKPQ